jgi:hypothetical protein
MRIYLSAAFERRDTIREYARELREDGHEVVSTWHEKRGDGYEDLSWRQARICAEEDLEDLQKADLLVGFTERPDSPFMRGGRHVEFGIAVQRGIQVAIIGEWENVFHCLKYTMWCIDWLHFMCWIRAKRALAEAEKEEAHGTE